MTTEAVAATSKGENTRERILTAAERLILAKGYTGTSVDDILAATKLTKGAFFYHFKSKSELARAVVERFWQRDYQLFVELWRQAEAQSDDPLEAVLILFRLTEETIAGMDAAMVSCLFASYLYEREQFDPAILDFIRDSFREWAAFYEARFDAVLKMHKPKIAITAAELAEIAIALFEGGFVLAQSYRDPDMVVRQSRHFRRYLQMLFAD